MLFRLQNTCILHNIHFSNCKVDVFPKAAKFRQKTNSDQESLADFESFRALKKDPSAKSKPLVARQIAPTRQTDYGPVCNGQVIPSGT